MILVLERDPERPARYKTRVVQEPGEIGLPSLLDVRLALRSALEDLPGRADLLTVCPLPQRRKDDRRTT